MDPATNEPGRPILAAEVVLVSGVASGGGDLRIDPGSISVTVRGLLRRVFGWDDVKHTGSSVVMYCAAVAPPWFNSSIILQDEDRMVAACFGGASRRRFREALRAAGFAVDERRTVFSLGKRGLEEGRPRDPIPRWIFFGTLWAVVVIMSAVLWMPTPLLIVGGFIGALVVAELATRSSRAARKRRRRKS